jgi:Tfp pilus assembly protein PilF
MMKPFVALDKARENLQRAMDLDYTMAEAHCTSALIKGWYEFDWDGAEREFQTALSLDPRHVTALIWRSLYFTVLGQHDEAIASVSGQEMRSHCLPSPTRTWELRWQMRDVSILRSGS